MTEKEKIRKEVERIQLYTQSDVLKQILDYIDSLQEEPVSEDLEEVAEHLSKIYAGEGSVDHKREGFAFYIGFKNGAKWQKEHLWKSADGDDLPEIDREVIALLNNGKVVFAHRPYKGKYIGKNLATGNVETFENETYDKGGWNIPDVKYWLDCNLPEEKED